MARAVNPQRKTPAVRRYPVGGHAHSGALQIGSDGEWRRDAVKSAAVRCPVGSRGCLRASASLSVVPAGRSGAQREGGKPELAGGVLRLPSAGAVRGGLLPSGKRARLAR